MVVHQNYPRTRCGPVIVPQTCFGCASAMLAGSSANAQRRPLDSNRAITVERRQLHIVPCGLTTVTHPCRNRTVVVCSLQISRGARFIRVLIPTYQKYLHQQR